MSPNQNPKKPTVTEEPSAEASPTLSRREREIMDVIYARGSASAQAVQAALADPPSYSAVRALLRILVEKGHLRHEQEGPRYRYFPTVPREAASEQALERVVRTFFEGKAERAVAALLDLKRADLDEEKLEQLQALIDQARAEGR